MPNNDLNVGSILTSVLSRPEVQESIFKELVSLLRGLFSRHSTPVQVGSTTVTPPPPPPAVVTVPAHIAAPDIALLKVQHGLVQDRNHQDVSPERMAEVDNGNANLDNGSFLHTDCSPIMDDGTELTTGDPRWATVQRGVLGDKKPLAIWFYYVADGRSTLDGFHAPWVSPESVEDDERCTVTYHLDPPQGAQHTFAYGYQYLRWDGRLVDPGPIGRGNKSLLAGGTAFTIV